jgi:hypothetical protein
VIEMVLIVLEVLLEVFSGVVVELLGRAIASLWNEELHPVLAVSGWLLVGTMCGGFSLVLFRHALAASPAQRLSVLALVPVVTGVMASVLGRRRSRRGLRALRVDRFAWGFLFALAFAVVRFAFARLGDPQARSGCSPDADGAAAGPPPSAVGLRLRCRKGAWW